MGRTVHSPGVRILANLQLIWRGVGFVNLFRGGGPRSLLWHNSEFSYMPNGTESVYHVPDTQRSIYSHLESSPI